MKSCKFACLLLVLAQLSPLRAGKPSTPEERAKAVSIARALETEPLGKQAKEQRRWIVTWLIEVSDISVKACNNLLGPAGEGKKSYDSELFGQTLASAAAFVITNPDKAKDDIAVYGAALEGALKAYEAILKAEPKAKRPFLDDLLVKREQGQLAGYVREAAMRCK